MALVLLGSSCSKIKENSFMHSCLNNVSVFVGTLPPRVDSMRKMTQGQTQGSNPKPKNIPKFAIFGNPKVYLKFMNYKTESKIMD